MGVPPVLATLAAVVVGIAVGVLLHRFLRRASARANRVAFVVVAGVLGIAVLVALAR